MNTLSLEDYQEFVKGCIHPGVHADDLSAYARYGYQAEIGEVTQVLSKALRVVRASEPLPEEHWQKFVDECGDVFHYWMQYQISHSRWLTNDCKKPYMLAIGRDYPIAKIGQLIRNEIFIEWSRNPKVVITPDLTLEKLAYINQQKLLSRKEEIGTFAKP